MKRLDQLAGCAGNGGAVDEVVGHRHVGDPVDEDALPQPGG